MLSENEELGSGVEWDPFPASQPLAPLQNLASQRIAFVVQNLKKHTSIYVYDIYICMHCMHLSVDKMCMCVMWPCAERLRGKSCAVTGASEGLGAVIAIHLAQAGVTCQHLISAPQNSLLGPVGDDFCWRY